MKLSIEVRPEQIQRERVRRDSRRAAGLCPICGRARTDACTTCAPCRRARAVNWMAWKTRQRDRRSMLRTDRLMAGVETDAETDG